MVRLLQVKMMSRISPILGLFMCWLSTVSCDSEAIPCFDCPTKCQQGLCRPNLSIGFGRCICEPWNLDPETGFRNSISSSSALASGGAWNGNRNKDSFSSSSIINNNGKVYAINSNNQGIKVTKPCDECQKDPPKECDTICNPDPQYGPDSCSCTGPPNQGSVVLNYGF